MNARNQVFEMTVDGRQVEEVALSLFHILLFHRTQGKFHYKQEGSYSMGTIGYEDVDCDFVDFTYVRCDSVDLDRTVKKEISAFADLLLGSENCDSGQISLEFYQKKKTRWPFSTESIPWEIWTIKFNLVTPNNETERNKQREEVGAMLAEKVLYIAKAMNKQEYVPMMPSMSELELIFDNSYVDIQPYLFKFSYQTNGPANTSVGTTVRKLIKDTLAL